MQVVNVDIFNNKHLLHTGGIADKVEHARATINALLVLKNNGQKKSPRIASSIEYELNQFRHILNELTKNKFWN